MTEFNKNRILQELYVVTTEPSLKKITEGNARKFTVSFAFCPRVR